MEHAFIDVLIDRLSVQSNVFIILMNQSVLRLIIPHTSQMLTFEFDDWRFEVLFWSALVSISIDWYWLVLVSHHLLLICSLLITTDGLINIVIGCIIWYSGWNWYWLVIDAIVVLITLFFTVGTELLITDSGLYWSLVINTEPISIDQICSFLAETCCFCRWLFSWRRLFVWLLWKVTTEPVSHRSMGLIDPKMIGAFVLCSREGGGGGGGRALRGGGGYVHVTICRLALKSIDHSWYQ